MTETEGGKKACAMWSAFDCNPSSSLVFLPPFPLWPKPNQAFSEIRAAGLVLPKSRSSDSNAHLSPADIKWVVMYAA